MRKFIKIFLIALLLITLLTSCGKKVPVTDGKSAYEVAVENGFSGTVEEWLASLIGQNGKDGTGIEKVEIDYKGAIVITMTNGERYELWAEKFCTHDDMSKTITLPTCGEAGYTSYSCNGCGVAYKDDYTAPTGHHLINDICFYCGYEVPYSEITPNIDWYISSESIFTLKTREDLAGLSYLVNNGTNFSGKTILVEGHIDLGNAEWMPIGTPSTPFSGTFDGQNFTISGLKITNPTSYVGFFGYVNGTIKNFKLNGANVIVNGTVTIDNYAAIACAYSTTVISGVSTAGHLTAITTNYVGGVVGYVASSIENCSNSADISAPEASYVGGVAGHAGRTGSYSMTNLSNSGTIEGFNNVGGLIGHYDNHTGWDYNDTNYVVQLDGIENNGKVSGQQYVGGLIGYSYLAITGYSSDGVATYIMTNSSNRADISGSTYVGGLLGYSYTEGQSEIISATSSANITAQAYVGGLVGKIENIKLKGCDNSGSKITATYYYSDGATYYAYVGGYAGVGQSFENCHNASEIIYNERGIFVGGIAGYINGTIVNCSNTANVTATKSNYVGGLVGRFNSAGSYDFTTLLNTGNITGSDYVGGIMGSLTDIATWDYNDSTYRVNMIGFDNSGNVTGYNYVGGFIGYSDVYISGYSSEGAVIIKLSDSVNNANVSGDTYVGGIYGYAVTDTGDSMITKTTSSGTITAKTNVGGLAGELSNVRLIECSNAGTEVIATSYTSSGTTYYAYVGGYAGQCGYIENCHNASNITYDERGQFVGGLAGVANGSIINCSNTGNITAEKANFVAGIAGLVELAGNTSYTDLSNSGTVVGANYTGGLIGYLNNHAGWDYNDTNYNISVRNNNNSGAVSGVKYVGGLIGRVNAQITGYSSDGTVSVNILDSANSGSIAGQESVGSYIGEFYSDRASYINNCILAGSVNGEATTLDTVVAVKSNLTISET